jgi:hypothetical protein
MVDVRPMKNNVRIVSPPGALATFVLLAVLAVASAEELMSLSIRATAPITSNALDAARASAIAKAERQSLEEFLRARLLSAAEYQKHAATLERVLLANPQPYLASFLVENHEIAEEGKIYAIKATATVRANTLTLALLENGIGDVFSARQPRPTMIALVKERFETRVTGTGAAEATLVKLLQQRGIRVLDPEQTKLIELRKRVAAEGRMDITNAAQAALGFQAEYLVLGAAAVTSSAPLAATDLKSRMANVTLNLIEVASARVLATETAQASTKHIDELTGGNWALEDAMKKASAALLIRFESILRQELLTGAEIVVDLYGLSSADQAEAAIADFKTVPNVAAIAQRFYHGGMAQLEIRYAGETVTFTREATKLSLDGQPVSLVEQFARYIRLQRGDGPPLRTNSLDLFRQFATEKYKQFDLEKARERDRELLRQVNALAGDQRVNDQQRKELHAARKAVEVREQEVFHRQQQLQQRERELAASNRALEESRLATCRA